MAVSESEQPDRSEQQAVPLRICFFESFAVHVNGKLQPRLKHQRGERLLAVLTRRLGHPVSREILIEELWPGEQETVDEQQLRTRLRTVLFDVRRVLGAAGDSLIRVRDGLILTNAWVDVLEFETAVERGGETALKYAVSLYRGPVVESWVGEWDTGGQERLRGSCIGALLKLAENALRRREHAQASQYVRRAIRIDPQHETAYRDLMLVQCAEGDYKAAAATFRVCRSAVRRPSGELVALFQEILKKQAQQAQKTARDLIDALNVPPVCDVGVGSNAFVGREMAVAEIERRLQYERLIVLTGFGGLGKTRLAFQVAAEACEGFAHGVWSIELPRIVPGEASERPLDLEALSARVADKLGAHQWVGPSATAALKEFLREKQLLLLLDACEEYLVACRSYAVGAVRGKM